MTPSKSKRDSILIRLPLGPRAAEEATAERTGGFSRLFRSSSAAVASSARVITLGRPEVWAPGVPQTRPRLVRNGWLIAIGVLFFLALVAGAACVYIKHETRQARFELTEMKQQQLLLIKDRERVNRQIATYKRLDDIAARAGARGLQQPDNTKVIKLP